MKPPKNVKSLQTFLSLVLTLNVRYSASFGDLKGSITSSTGKSSTMHPDYKPLEAIFKKKLSDFPPRL